MKEAAFSLKEYQFNHVKLDLIDVGSKEPLNIDLIPSGKFISANKEFILVSCLPQM